MFYIFCFIQNSFKNLLTTAKYFSFILTKIFLLYFELPFIFIHFQIHFIVLRIRILYYKPLEEILESSYLRILISYDDQCEPGQIFEKFLLHFFCNITKQPYLCEKCRIILPFLIFKIYLSAFSSFFPIQ